MAMHQGTAAASAGGGGGIGRSYRGLRNHANEIQVPRRNVRLDNAELKLLFRAQAVWQKQGTGV